MKKNVKALAALFLASFAFLVTACNTDVKDTTPTDTTAPAKVSDITVSAANGKAVLTWTNPADEDFYATCITVVPSVENGNSSLVIEGSTSKKSSASFEGLTNGTEYTFTLYAMDKSLNVSESVEKKVTPEDTSDTTAPAEVTDITVTAANGNTVLTWTNPTDDDFAGVKITMTPAVGTLANPVTLDKGVTTFTVSGLENGKEYTFKVQSFDDSLNFAEGAKVAATSKYSSDTTAPASVTNLVASAKDKSVLLTWTDAVDTDNDIYGYEVSWTSDNASRAVTALEANSMVVAQGVCGAIVQNLTNGTEYTFTVKTLDTSFNKSAEATATATPVENPSTDVLKIELSVPDEKSNTSVTVTANITTAGTVKRVVYKKDGSINPAKLLADSDAIEATADASDNSKWTFTISATDETANGTYTVAAIDSDGREEIEQIAINNFDFTAPAKPKVASGVYSSDTSSITLNWTNPDDEDFDHVEIYYTTTDANGTSEKSTVENVTEANKTYSNIDAEKSYYTFYLASVDKLENKSGETTYTVRVNTPASDIPGFVKVPAASITGTETWTPSSETFVSGRALEIASFYMCDHEVTQTEFETVMGTNPSTATADGTAANNPVNYVNWYAAIAYCNKLSVKEGLTPCYTITGITDTDWENLEYSSIPTSKNSTWNATTCDFTANGYRLPTEAEWEWAARGGENYTYAGSNTIDDVAWYTGNTKDSGTKEIKTKNANTYGLYDMSGNVWEWTWDWYGSISSSTDATGSASGSCRVLRGGSGCGSAANLCTVSFRSDFYPHTRNGSDGFRVVRNIQ